jgi:O-antigen ligase
MLERQTLQNLSLKVISQHPLFGTGANASISTYPTASQKFRLLQPDHNSTTLLFSWFGIFGTLSILFLLRSKFQNLRIYDLRFILPLSPLLLLDHYFLTSPQGMFILIIFLSITINYPYAQNNLK